MKENFRFNPHDAESMKTCDPIILEKKKNGESREEITNSLMECLEPGCTITYKALFEKIRHRWTTIRQTLTPEERAAIDAVVGQKNNFSDENANSVKDVLEVTSSGVATSEKTVPAEEIPDMNKANGVSELLKLHGFDPNLYDLKSFRTSKWEAPDPDGGTRQLGSSRITVAPKSAGDIDVRDIAEGIIGAVNKKGNRFFVKPDPPANLTGEGCYIVPLADFHLDKRDPNEPAGSFERQVERFYKIIGKHVAVIEKRQKEIGKIVFFWSQDFFNYDNYAETTTSGTQQDAAMGYDKMISTGYIMLINAIETFRRYAPTEIFYTRSNHDTQTALVVAGGLAARFRDDPYITIDGANSDERMDMWNRGVLFDTTSPRKYLRWGKCLFGFAHGDFEGKRIRDVMAVESDRYFAEKYCIRKNIPFDPNGDMPDELEFDAEFVDRHAWSRTRTHVFFCGHFHSKKVDTSGVEVNYLPSDQTGDRWHKNSGYIGAQRRSEGYLYFKNGDYEVFGFQSQNL